MRRVLVILTSCAIIICAATSGADSPRPSTSAGNGGSAGRAQNAPDNRGTEQSPLVIRISPETKSAEQSAAEERDRSEARDREDKKLALDQRLTDYNRDLAWYTRVLAIVAVVQLVSLLLQTWFLGGTLRATDKAAGAAEKTANDAAVTAERQLRAYVAANPNHIFNFSSSVSVAIKYTIVNHGETPAYRTSTIAKIDLLPNPLPADFTFPKIPLANRATYTVQPSETFWGETVADRPFTEAEIEDAIAGSRSIYIYGLVSYVDAFGKNRETRFCRMIPGGEKLRIVATGGSISDGEFPFILTDQHNDAT